MLSVAGGCSETSWLVEILEGEGGGCSWAFNLQVQI